MMMMIDCSVYVRRRRRRRRRRRSWRGGIEAFFTRYYTLRTVQGTYQYQK